MTSKNSYSKGIARQIWQLMGETLRHQLWAVALFVLALFFALPVPILKYVQDALEARRQGRESYQLEAMGSLLGLENIFVGMIVAGGAILLAAVVFRFMHSRQQVDFYHSLPVRRGTFFAARYLAGFALFAAAYLANLAIASAIVACSGFAPVLADAQIPSAIASHMVFFLLIYSICVLAHQLAGTTATGVLCCALLFIGPPAAVGLYTAYMEMFFDNWFLPDLILERAMKILSPMWMYFSIQSEGAEKPGWTLLLWLLAAVVIALACAWLYQRRPSEKAGQAVAFRLPAAVLKYVAVFLCTLGCGMFFYLLGDRQSWLFFGFLCGGLLSHCLVEIIYHLDFKAAFCHIRAFGVFALAFIALYAMLAMDVFHYDTFLPEQDQVQAVSILTPMADVSVERDNNWSYGRQQMDRLDRLAVQEPDNIAAALRMCGQAVEQSQQEVVEQQPADTQSSSIAFPTPASVNRSGFDMVVRYTLESGRQVYRRYDYVTYDSVAEDLVALMDSQEFKTHYYPIYSMDAAAQKTMLVDQSGMEQFRESDSQTIQAVADALRQEILATPIEELMDQAPVALLTFSEWAKYDGGYYQASNGQYYGATTRVPVYASYEQTVRLLAQRGAYINTRVSVTDVQQATLYNESHWDLEEMQKYGTEEEKAALAALDEYVTQHQIESSVSWEGSEIIIRDPELIALLLQNAVSADMAYYNPFFQASSFYLQLTQDSNRGIYQERMYPYGQFPLQ